MKSFLISLLQFFAKRILRKYKPVVVGITGSVGKTSTKEAVFAVLSSKFSVLASPKNYNNELGVPLTIIGARAPGASPVKWCAVFCRALWVWIFPRRYPAIAILEMGADRPKDIAKLVALAPPFMGVVTAVAPVHTEFFGSVKRVAVEKRKLVEAVPKEGTAVLNFDDEIVRGFAEHTDGEIISYGIEEKVGVQGVEIVEYLASDIVGEIGGVHFKILHDGSAVPIHLKNVLGHQHVYAALAAAAVGRAFEMNMVEISNALLKYVPPPGRMRLISGVKGTVLIDDTYNSSPRAAIAALESLGRLAGVASESSRRYAVLADMLELGNLMESSHREVGRAAAQESDVLIAVGSSARWIAEEAVKSGMPKENVFNFHTLEGPVAECAFVAKSHRSERGEGKKSQEYTQYLSRFFAESQPLLCDCSRNGIGQQALEEGVEHFLQERIQTGDVILIKGSQGMRMERLVYGLMAEPLQAKKLLCRQDKEWVS